MFRVEKGCVQAIAELDKALEQELFHLFCLVGFRSILFLKEDGEKMGKGVTLSKEEVVNLRKLLDGLDLD